MRSGSGTHARAPVHAQASGSHTSRTGRQRFHHAPGIRAVGLLDARAGATQATYSQASTRHCTAQCLPAKVWLSRHQGVPTAHMTCFRRPFPSAGSTPSICHTCTRTKTDTAGSDGGHSTRSRCVRQDAVHATSGMGRGCSRYVDGERGGLPPRTCVTGRRRRGAFHTPTSPLRTCHDAQFPAGVEVARGTFQCSPLLPHFVCAHPPDEARKSHRGWLPGRYGVSRLPA
jgi:hypothetical protein